MTEGSPLVIPRLWWDPGHGFKHLSALIGDALDDGVGAFVVSGGPRDAVAALVGDLHARSQVPLLVAAETDRGAGQQFEGCTGLPPLEALVSRASTDDVIRSARLTASELKSLGVNWCLSPPCDAKVATEWIDACQSQGVIACARTFPGPHLAAAVDAGVASILLANAEHAARARRELSFDDILISAQDGSYALAAGSSEALSRWAAWARPSDARETTMDDALWARQVADRCVMVVRGPMPALSTADVIVAGVHGGATNHFAATLRALDVEVSEVSAPSEGTRSPVLIAAFSEDRTAVGKILSLVRHRQRECVVVVFAPPSAAGWLPGDVKVLCAWCGDRPMQEAAARVLVRS